MNSLRISNQNEVKHPHGTYVMTASFRVLDNHSLNYLLKNYNTYNIVLFREPKNIKRQDDFFLKHSTNLLSTLSKICNVSYTQTLKSTLDEIQGDIILDKAYLKEDKKIEETLINYAKYKELGYTIIESNVVVPVTIASNKEEYGARTIRSKIFKHLYDFIDPVNESLEKSDMEKSCDKLCKDFIKHKLGNYHLKNHPELNHTSNLSVYLKYGIISPIRIWILLDKIEHENKESFLDELIIRRELAYNFVYYNDKYYDFNYMTSKWAYDTMKNHEHDVREYVYSIDDYIHFRTHDEYFNTAMKEMVYFGRMHGYMRMYWCKKILEWSVTYKQAYETAIYLNNHYFLDGDTPNGYAGVAWCFGKHDRPWGEREIFGKLRYMNANGLKRKFDIEQYVLNVRKEIDQNETKKS